jgi:GNAT superfamily N-acetyltransferase
VTRRSTEPIAIACAEKGEEAVASAIMEEAVNWLAARGEPMWEAEEVSAEVLRPRVEAQELYLARTKGEAVGVMILQWEDPRFWPDVPRGQSAFIHRLAVKRSVAGKGVSHALIDWAKSEASREKRKYLRLDCDAQRPRLCAFYESAGFVRHSVVRMGRHLVARYEMALSS